MKYESAILKRLIDTYGVVGNPRYISEIIKEFIVQGKECFPNLFTYQADWLAHIDEFGLSPSYTVSYTGQSIYAPNTLERPVKSAILKGQTLVNLANYELSTSSNELLCSQDFSLQKNNTAYTLFNFTDKIITFNTYTTSGWRGFENVGANSKKLLTLNNFTIKEVIGRASNGWDKTTETEKFLNGYMIIEGDYTNADIPYFDGMQSVKMPVLTTTGKNLFDGKLENGAIISSTGSNTPSTDNVRSVGYIKVNPNASLVLSNDLNYSNNIIYEYDSNKDFIGRKETNPFTTSTNCQYIRFRSNSNQPNLDVKYQIEYGTQPTTYEPYKSNILTTSEEVELRGIGDVKDELNLITGELTERIGEVVFDGSDDEKWRFDTLEPWTNGEYYTFNIHIQNTISNFNGLAPQTANSKYPDISYSQGRENGFGCFLYSGGGQAVAFRQKNITTLEDWKTHLQDNPITVQYRLANESIKTVDLTILGQNGQTVKQLMAFNGGTHFNTGSLEGTPLPSVSVSVETDLEETLMVCSLEGNTM